MHGFFDRVISDCVRHVTRACRWSIACAMAGILIGCVHLPEGQYRFQTEFERDPMAFRAAAQPEPLAIAVKLQNLSDRNMLLAGRTAENYGLELTARITNAPAYLGQPQVVPGLRGGSWMRRESEASQELWLDRHAGAVQALAQAGRDLLHLDPDNVRSALGLFANEAALNVVIPVDWKAVPTTPFVVPVQLDLAVSVTYRGPDGERYTFPGILERRIEAYLVNGRRYASGSMPAPSGPISGEFQRVKP